MQSVIPYGLAVWFMLSFPIRYVSADPAGEVQTREETFLVGVADAWLETSLSLEDEDEAPEPGVHARDWNGAMASLCLARSEEEIARANRFLENLSISEDVTPEDFLCRALHTYYLFRDTPNLTPGARRNLLEQIHTADSLCLSWEEEGEENRSRGLMRRTGRLLRAQIDRDRETMGETGHQLQVYIVEQMEKGWLEYGNVCGNSEMPFCLILLAEWAEDPFLQKKAELALDLLIADCALPDLGIRQGEFPPEECRPMMTFLFGENLSDVQDSFAVAALSTSQYVPPRTVSALAEAVLENESLEIEEGSPETARGRIGGAPFLISDSDPGILKVRFGPYRMTINVARDLAPERTEEFIQPLSLPYHSDCDEPDETWVPFLNYWRLKPEQWYWAPQDGKSGGCLRHEAALGVRDPRRGAHDAAIILRGGETWTDYVFEADGYASRGHFGLWVRADMHVEGSGNGRWVQGYYLGLDPGHQKWRLWRARVDGLVLKGEDGEELEPERNHFSNPILLTEGALPASATYGTWMHLRIEAKGSRLAASVDREPILSVGDERYPAGSVGFTTYKGQDVRFDNVRVVAIEDEGEALHHE